MKKVYICAPLGGDVKGNLEKVKRYTRFALMCGTAPVVPHFYALCLDDDIEKEREIGIVAGLGMLWFCDELWVFGDEVTVPWLDDFPRQYASWPRHYACRQRSASYCTAIRSRLERKSQYDVRCACNNYGSQSHTLHRKGKVRMVAI